MKYEILMKWLLGLRDLIKCKDRSTLCRAYSKQLALYSNLSLKWDELLRVGILLELSQ